MERVTRRRALALAGLTAGTGLAGCLSGRGDQPTDSPSSSPTDEPPTDDEPVSATPSGDPPQTGDGLTYRVKQIGPRLEAPEWWRDDADSPGAIELFASARKVERVLDYETIDADRRDEVTAFVENTDFFGSRLLFVESVGPDTCHSKVAIDSLGVDDDAVAGAGAAVDPSEGTPACGDAITFPSALVRISFEGSPQNTARITVSSGMGDTGELTARAAVSVDDLAGFVRPEGDPQTTPPALDCANDDFTRHPQAFEESSLSWGMGPAADPHFALRVNDTEFAHGDEVVVTMTNITNSPQVTGNRDKYNLQVKTEAGWQDVRGSLSHSAFPYTDEGIGHQPGDGFRWRFDLTELGVLEDHADAENLTVCPGLPAGRYRFVFWEPVVGVAFDVVE